MRRRVTAVMKTLADPTRRRIFERIARRSWLSVSALAQGLRVSQPAVSQHLQTLRKAGLVKERRDGRYVRYRVDPRGLAPMIDWLEIYGAFGRERFANLEKLSKGFEP